MNEPRLVEEAVTINTGKSWKCWSSAQSSALPAWIFLLINW